MLQERFEGLSLQEAAKVADAYFDQDGKPRHINKQQSINAIQEPASDLTSPFSDDTDEVNAINRRFKNQRFGSYNNSQRGSRGSTPKAGSIKTPANQTTQQKPNATFNDPALCFYHNEYGNKAKKCEVGCSRFDEKRFAGNGKAGK